MSLLEMTCADGRIVCIISVRSAILFRDITYLVSSLASGMLSDDEPADDETGAASSTDARPSAATVEGCGVVAVGTSPAEAMHELIDMNCATSDAPLQRRYLYGKEV